MIGLGLFSGLLMAKETGALELVTGGRSQWQICVPDAAPESVRFAAEELTGYLEKATGARFPVVRESELKEGNYISLGATRASDEAKVIDRPISRDGYRIVSRAGNLYIRGTDDEVSPDNRYFEGVSKGTLYGVYSFLEESLGIRWLVPGEIGEDVPTSDEVRLEPVDRGDEPPMFYRIIQGVNERTDAATMLWKLRNRHGYHRKIEHGHNWMTIVPPASFEEHPEWFAEFEGKRLPPGLHYKLETTDPTLVRHFADTISGIFDREPERFSFSISPTDGQGWSQSAESRKLDDVTPDGQFSASRRVLSFYNEVAREVARKHPDRLLGGYIYDRYFFPPGEGELKVEPNLFLMIAPLQNYGFQLFRPEVRHRFEPSLKAWTTAARHWGYYDLPVTMMPNGASLITPPCLGILEYLYGRLAENGCEAVYLSGNPAFGYGGVLNYLLARLNWNPSLNVRELAREFYERAYGREAGNIMARLDASWEEAFEHYYRSHPASYHLTEELARELFAPFYPRLEAEYLKALAAASAPLHRARLQEYGKNLGIMQWLLRQRGLIPADPASPLFLTTREVEAMIRHSGEDPFLVPAKFSTALSNTDEGRLTILKAPAPLTPGEETPLLLRGPSRWLLAPEGEGSIRIFCTRMPLEEIVSYRIVDERQQPVASGLLAEGEVIHFKGEAGKLYQLDTFASRAAYGLRIEGARHALKTDGRFRHKLWLHAVDGTFPALYLFPEKETFEVHLGSISTREVVKADLLDPEGKVVASFDTTKGPLQSRRITAGERGRPWTLVFRRSDASRYAFIQMGEGVPSWVGVAPDQLLRVRP